jgi:hypothetical protein
LKTCVPLYCYSPKERPLKNVPFCPIPAPGENFNPQNTQCIPACPVGPRENAGTWPAGRTGVVKIFALTRGVHTPRPYGQLESCPILLSCRIVLGLEPRLNMKYGFNPDGINRKINSSGQAGQAKLSIF